MKGFPHFQIDSMFGDIAPPPPVDKTKTSDEKPADTTTASTTEPAPLKPQATGVLDPISGMQTFILVMFAVLSFVMLLFMVNYGSNKNYGD